MNINPREKSTGSQFAKLILREMLKKMTRENKSTRKTSVLKVTIMTIIRERIIVLSSNIPN